MENVNELVFTNILNLKTVVVCPEPLGNDSPDTAGDTDRTLVRCSELTTTKLEVVCPEPLGNDSPDTAGVTTTIPTWGYIPRTPRNERN